MSHLFIRIGALVAALACFGPAPAASLSLQDTAAVDDGPYIFLHNANLEAVWVCDGKTVRREFSISKPVTVAPICGFQAPIHLPSAPPKRFLASQARLASGARIIALSDIHGQYGVMMTLLRANKIITPDGHWNAGHDTLVITGDVFDRGPQVTETFWQLFQLQQEASAAGGAVQFLLGNHETMVLYEDTRYVNDKYITVAKQLGMPYAALYGKNTVLGRWLRTRPVMLKIGDTLFLHGGIAPENLDLVTKLDATNAAYDASIGLPKKQVKEGTKTRRLYDGKRSPIWYRGYFNGDLSTEDVQALVKKLGLSRIVVGHTTMGEVASFHDGKVIAIDSGIKRGKAGQLLFIEGDKLSRGMMDGSREPLPALHDIPEDND
ncbi:MAG: metallophosphoesterase [Thermomonas sp.]|uniref:metallophosphoesterase n=1 Tax=Thermomonas sp. TaxID=1971895 RepID=UPI001EB1AC17|nr:metallophosphoesterase [Thermomonas sp.]MBV2210019.1 metallophosphoesterase [Thermomonas sp.]